MAQESIKYIPFKNALIIFISNNYSNCYLLRKKNNLHLKPNPIHRESMSNLYIGLIRNDCLNKNNFQSNLIPILKQTSKKKKKEKKE